jgi:putative endonuclease
MPTPDKSYYVYIVTNPNRTTLYIGVTNNLQARVAEHWENKGKPETFAGKYFCYNLIYYEIFQYVLDAIAREKEIKKWNRQKKESLIATKNPEWTFLNEKIFGCWPPKNIIKRF